MPGILETTDLGEVERITTGRSLLGLMPTTAHCYRIGSTLVDAGSPRQAERLLQEIGDHDVTHVLLTHEHEDHVGAAAALAKRGARVLAPEPLLEVLESPPELPYFREMSWGGPEPVDAEPLGKSIQTPDARFEVVSTPGHSPHHVTLFETERAWVFSGDAYLGRRLEHRFAEQLGPMLSSLRALADLDPSRLFPGHGRVLDDPAPEIEATVDWYEDLVDQAAQLRAQGHHVQRVRSQLLGREGLLTLYTGGEFSKGNLARQLLRLANERAKTSPAQA